ncbi:hypothetical protein [Alysiella filiformis]|uniref:Uncharacterized protein n=1 Tax=Alysiella filiformis DSM 16848 TaxID=1120981 RepID=A0A286EB80_9NEIS|nr:hypothetical protein [Alysiella filiformis]QMT32229.1 hypothetical protein H3L97_05190 [Alysiella filiformis]UBQ56851.1 hypothetical protein JF568_03495 [Alysiella filiformis DSM 16848]SOD68094.1 hypothetical protein SAMN02746062_01125 [Alysiella filiformis DSM 16848]
MRVNATHWRVFLTQKLAILMKKQSRNELSLAPSDGFSGSLKPFSNLILMKKYHEYFRIKTKIPAIF